MPGIYQNVEWLKIQSHWNALQNMILTRLYIIDLGVSLSYDDS